MAKLELFLLGNPQICVDGQAVTNFNTRKDQALLIYLAVTGTPHSRETLASLFWSDLPEGKARRNLRHSLSHLQKVIGPQWLAPERTVALTREHPWSADLHILRMAVQTLTAKLPLATARDHRPTVAAVEQLLRVYRGEFLHGFHLHRAAYFEEWVLAQREELRMLTLHGLEAAADQCLAQGAYDQGLMVTRRLLQLEPWFEPGYRWQMQLLAHSGRRAEALTLFEKCQEVLAVELGVKPEQTTIALYEQIRDGLLSRVGQAAEVTVSPIPDFVSPLSHNLPGQLTLFIGRDDDLTRTRTLLLSPGHHLITIVGEGGIGKTRLALAVAQTFVAAAQPGPSATASSVQPLRPFPDGIGYVPLAGLTAGESLVDQLATAVANALHLQLSGQTPLLQQIQEYLRDKRLLLLFDNIEHLLPQAADFLIELLQHAPHLKLMATSRHLLNLQAETIVRLVGLPTPHPQDVPTLTPAALLTYSSVALFVERAGRANPTFRLTAANQTALVQICQMVDGLPLAIELAAAQTRHYSCQQILTALQQSYAVLNSTQRDLAPRHRSIRALLDYSWQFLNPESARLLTACSIFHGIFAGAAVAAIMDATPEQLYALVDQSLVQLAPGGEQRNEPRFALHELIRQHGAAQLQAQPDERHRLHTAHCRYYLTLLIEQSQIFVHDLAALQQMQSDIDNLRAAWEWAAGQGQWELLAASAHSLRQFYDLLGLYHEAESNFARTIAQVQQHLPDQSTDAWTRQERLVVHLQTHQLHFCRRLSHIAKAEALAQTALAVGRQLDDHAVQGYVYLTLCTIYGLRGDWVGGQRAAEQALVHAQAAALPLLEVQSLQCVGALCLNSRQTEQALDYLHRALALYQTATTTGATGPSFLIEGLLCLDLGMAYQSAGDWAQAHAYCQQSIDLYRQMSIPILGVNALSYLSELNAQLGSFVQASIDAQMGLEICRSMGGSHNSEATLLGNLAYVCLHLGDWAQADHACQLLFHCIQPLGATRLQAFAYFLQGELQRSQKQWHAALVAYESAEQGYTALRQMERAVSSKAKMAQVWQATGDLPQALAKLEEVLPHLNPPLQSSWLETSADYLICYQVMVAAHDPRAAGILQQGYQYVQEQAQRITDEALRHSYLTNVTANRALVELAAQVGLPEAAVYGRRAGD